MKIFINCSNLHLAGGLNVSLNVLKEFTKNQYLNDTFFIVAPKNVGYEIFDNQKNFEFRYITYFRKEIVNLAYRFYIDYFFLNKLIDFFKPNVIFSLGNLPTPNKNEIPQGVLFMYPYIAYFDNLEIFNRLNFKEKLKKYLIKYNFKRRLKYANIFFPQTDAIGERLKRFYGISRYVTFPCAYTQIKGEIVIKRLLDRDSKNTKYILALTKYYSHKNLEVLLEVAEMNKINNLPIKILLTIEPNQHTNAKKILNSIKEKKIEKFIQNLGNINIEDVPNLYSQIDACIMPTLIESYSATFIDSFYFKKPLFISDLDFAKEQCKDHAFYFNPYDANSIFNSIKNNIFNDALLENKVNEAYIYCQNLPTWQKIVSGYYNELKNLSN